MANSIDEIRARQADAYGPVKLVYANQPMWTTPDRPIAMLQIEHFDTNAEALSRVSALLRTDHFHNFFVTDDEDHTIWTGHELIERCTL